MKQAGEAHGVVVSTDALRITLAKHGGDNQSWSTGNGSSESQKLAMQAIVPELFTTKSDTFWMVPPVRTVDWSPVEGSTRMITGRESASSPENQFPTMMSSFESIARLWGSCRLPPVEIEVVSPVSGFIRDTAPELPIPLTRSPVTSRSPSVSIVKAER